MSQLSPEVTDHQTRGAAAKIKNISALFFFFSGPEFRISKKLFMLDQDYFFFHVQKIRPFCVPFEFIRLSQ